MSSDAKDEDDPLLMAIMRVLPSDSNYYRSFYRAAPTIDERMAMILAWCSIRTFHEILALFQRAGADVNFVSTQTRRTMLNSLCASYWMLGPEDHGRSFYTPRIEALVDAGAQPSSDLEHSLKVVADRVALRNACKAIKRSALTAAFWCIFRHRLVPRDVARFALEPVARERLAWKEWIK